MATASGTLGPGAGLFPHAMKADPLSPARPQIARQDARMAAGGAGGIPALISGPPGSSRGAPYEDETDLYRHAHGSDASGCDRRAAVYRTHPLRFDRPARGRAARL